jgi:DNA-binding GntR family transcriptional regulator
LIQNKRQGRTLTVKTAAAEVYDAIKQRILDAVYGPHEFVRETRVAQELNVSRTPVREALRELVSEGWLEAIPHQGSRVVAWTEKDAQEVFEIRLVLEPMAVSAASQHISQPRIEYLKALATQMEALTEEIDINPQARNGIATLNHEFHQELIAASDNQRLSSVLESVVRTSVIRRNFVNYDPNHLQRSMLHHREILAAVEAGNGAWAENCMRTHLLAARDLHVRRSGPADETPEIEKTE